ncbi:MAG: MFS transporter [Eubacterium sp.]|nr:MFS transporter [Eubacterium sp.]
MGKGKLTQGQLNGYAACNLSISFANMLQMSYLTIFMTDYIGIPTAVVATTLLAARFIDLLLSFVSGMIMERLNLPWGKYRSWLLLIRWVVVFSMVCMFFNTSTFPVAARVAISIVGYSLMNMCMGIQMNAISALSPLLAGDNMTDRTRLTARNMQFACVANIAFALITLPIVNMLTPKVGAANAFLIVAIVYSVPCIFGAQLTSHVCKECDPGGVRGNEGGGKGMTIREMLRSIVENRQLLILVVVFTLYMIGMNIIMNLATYYYRYITGDLSNMTIASTITMVVSTVSSLFLPAIGRKIGKKRAMLIGLAIYAFAVFANRFAGPRWQFYAFFAAVAAAGTYFFNTFAALFFIDAGEFYYWKTGKDSRLMSVATYSIATKIAMILGGAIATYGLNGIGFNAGMEITPAFQTQFMTLLGIVPAIFVVAAIVIMAIGYKITDANAAIYAMENQRRAARNQNQ